MHSGHNVSAACLALFCVHVFFFRYFFLKNQINLVVSACITAALHACLHRVLGWCSMLWSAGWHSAVQGRGWREWTQRKSRGAIILISSYVHAPCWLLLCFLWIQIALCTALPWSLPIASQPSLRWSSVACMGLYWTAGFRQLVL